MSTRNRITAFFSGCGRGCEARIKLGNHELIIVSSVQPMTLHLHVVTVQGDN